MKRMKILIATLLLLSACGTQDKAAPAAATAPVTTAVKAASLPAADNRSFSVTEAAKLPGCTEDGEGWLAYVRSTAEFMACLSGSWTAIDIHGAKGEQGLAGAVGAKGDQGDRGEQGVAGPQGIAGIAGPQGEQGERGVQGIQGEQGLGSIPGVGVNWYDPDAHVNWIIVAKSVQYTDASCPGGYTLPNCSERLPAKFHSYFSSFEATLPAGATFWETCGAYYLTTINGSTSGVLSSMDSAPNPQHVYICHS